MPWRRKLGPYNPKEKASTAPQPQNEEIMQQQIQSRIAALKSEFETGQTKLRELEMQQSRIRETLLRISGAIQVLEEMLESNNANEKPAPPDSLPVEPSVIGKG
jgi:predicted nuclease with TOPRIM domain